MSTSKPSGGEDLPPKEPLTGKAQITQENPHKEERATIEHPDREIKETVPQSPTELLP